MVTATNGTILERKLRLAESLSCRALLDDLFAVEESIAAALTRRLEAEDALRHAKAEADAAETLACLAVEGKNESERKARRVEALRDDVAYQSAAELARRKESERDRLEAELEMGKRRATALTIAIKYRTSVLAFLAE